jgi:site-specific recombinase XerD
VATKLANAEGGEADEYLESWDRRLRARNRSEKTIRGYRETVQPFLQFLRCHEMPTAVGEVKREHVEAFIADQLVRWKPTTALTRHQALRQFFLYVVDEGELTDSPMARMKPPNIADVPVPIVPDNDLRRLLKVCEGTDFES